ncbi:uncharacterized mitochondrial protein AtMg00810-like [Capsicum annuum]|uniref:uncharacterized mitochondrial protein AtMg00810-like n=1 Tax=Capsicum annuum TaxID=4072 RepID=UPI001FB06C33|nr:uncharacterized mitochondrial protein AtMg00810-like [Capsicum annuum]
MEASLRIVKYIKKQPGQRILLSNNSKNEVTAFCDVDWETCLNTRRSDIGFMIKFGKSLVSWKSKKKTMVSRNSVEEEYRSLATTIAELTWLLGILKEIGVEVMQLVKVFNDSKSALQIATNPVCHERTKHIEIDCHFIREKIQ